MNDLDRKIAELKGIPYREHAQYNFIQELEGAATTWNSDAAALELVDELHPAHFFTLKSLPNSQGWKAVFQPDPGNRMVGTPKYTGQDMSRPKAICRAYIAAREWMAGRKGA